MRLHPEGLREFEQLLHRGIPFPAFDRPQILLVEPGPFAQGLLGALPLHPERLQAASQSEGSGVLEWQLERAGDRAVGEGFYHKALEVWPGRRDPHQRDDAGQVLF